MMTGYQPERTGGQKARRTQMSGQIALESFDFEDAAGEAHLSVTAFVLQAANRAAEDVLAERQAIRLSPEAASAFNEALNRPSQVNELLAKALQRRAKFDWLD